MNPKSYYNDDWDKIVSQFVLLHEPFDGYWVRSEQHALRLVDSLVRRKPKSRLLDLGCGVGRLLGRFAKLFEEVVALDADRVRLDQARGMAKVAKLENVQFVNQLFEECAGTLGKFDMVLCSHVIQHLPIDLLASIFKQISTILVQDGLVVLLTSHSRGEQDAFKLWSLTDAGRRVTEDILANACEFNEIVVDDHRRDRLPIHAFAIGSLRELMMDYRLLNVHCFHELHHRTIVDAILFRDDWINLPVLKGSFGIDILVIGKPRESFQIL